MTWKWTWTSWKIHGLHFDTYLCDSCVPISLLRKNKKYVLVILIKISINENSNVTLNVIHLHVLNKNYNIKRIDYVCEKLYTLHYIQIFTSNRT